MLSHLLTHRSVFMFYNSPPKVMEELWTDAGLNPRMNVYRCMTTDTKEGFIEVVGDAETICKIQMAAQGPYSVFI